MTTCLSPFIITPNDFVCLSTCASIKNIDAIDILQLILLQLWLLFCGLAIVYSLSPDLR